MIVDVGNSSIKLFMDFLENDKIVSIDLYDEYFTNKTRVKTKAHFLYLLDNSILKK